MMIYIVQTEPYKIEIMNANEFIQMQEESQEFGGIDPSVILFAGAVDSILFFNQHFNFNQDI